MVFAWWSGKKKTKPPRPKSNGNRIRPFLEGLEGRDCPSALLAPQITGFSATIMQGHTVMLAGMVSDPNPASVYLSFSGEATGSTTADSTGHFWLQTQAAALGTVFAVGVDGASQLLVGAQTKITVPAPTFTSLTVTQSGPNRAVTVMGQVSSGAGLTVTLSGVVTGTATTGTNGMFTFSGTASGLGQVNASVTDSWGQTGTAAALLTNAAPTITNFEAENTGFQNIWNIEGRVTDEWAPGLTVTFAGVPALQNVQVTVGNDGWFHIQVQLGPTDIGLLVATVTDWWGATGQAQYFI
jgi:hypothetical protein